MYGGTSNIDTPKSGQLPYNGQTAHPLPHFEPLNNGQTAHPLPHFEPLKKGQPLNNGQTAHPLPHFEPLKKGQPLNNGQNARPQPVHYTEVPLRIIAVRRWYYVHTYLAVMSALLGVPRFDSVKACRKLLQQKYACYCEIRKQKMQNLADSRKTGCFPKQLEVKLSWLTLKAQNPQYFLPFTLHSCSQKCMYEQIVSNVCRCMCVLCGRTHSGRMVRSFLTPFSILSISSTLKHSVYKNITELR